MTVVFRETYDTGEPRVRLLLRGLPESGLQVTKCHADVWAGIEDQNQVMGVKNRLRIGLRWLPSFPWLIWRYLRPPRHDAVVIGYMGQLDVLLLWPTVKLGGAPIVWDAFLSIYDTVLEDRKLVGRPHPLAYLLFARE